MEPICKRAVGCVCWFLAWICTPAHRPDKLVLQGRCTKQAAAQHPGGQIRKRRNEKNTKGKSQAASPLTCKCKLRQDKEIKVLGIGSVQYRVGAIEVVVDIADLRSELEAPDPHVAA